MTIKYKTNEQSRPQISLIKKILQNIHTETQKYSYNQVRLVLADFTSTKLA